MRGGESLGTKLRVYMPNSSIIKHARIGLELLAHVGITRFLDDLRQLEGSMVTQTRCPEFINFRPLITEIADPLFRLKTSIKPLYSCKHT